MTIYIGADHGGFDLKEKIKSILLSSFPEFEVVDKGALELNPTDDYPDFAFAVAEAVAQDTKENRDAARGILLCRSGGGMVIAANKVKGIRAVEVSASHEAKHAVTNDDANIISIAGDWVEEEKLPEIVQAFLETDYEFVERHQRRIEKIEQFEERSSS